MGEKLFRIHEYSGTFQKIYSKIYLNTFKKYSINFKFINHCLSYRGTYLVSMTFTLFTLTRKMIRYLYNNIMYLYFFCVYILYTYMSHLAFNCK